MAMKFYPTCDLVVPAMVVLIVLGFFVAHGPVHAGELGPVLGKPHSDSSAVLTNIALVFVVVAFGRALIQSLWAGGGLRHAPTLALRLRVRKDMWSWSKDGIVLGQLELLEAWSTLPFTRDGPRLSFVLGAPAAPANEPKPCSVEAEEAIPDKWRTKASRMRPTVLLTPCRTATSFVLGARLRGGNRDEEAVEIKYCRTIGLRRKFQNAR